jgi:multicomponent Na+:H+ antiporter subunit C
MELQFVIMHLPYILVMLMVAICIYGAIFKSNIFKKILALYLFTDAVNLLYIIQGFRLGEAIPPTLLPELGLSEFVSRSVDPLAQYFVVTAVVIGLAEMSTLIALAIYTYRHYGTLETKKIKELRG